MSEWIHRGGCVVGWVGGWTDERMCGWMGCVFVWVSGWIYGRRLCGYMGEGCVDGWVGGVIVGYECKNSVKR